MLLMVTVARLRSRGTEVMGLRLVRFTRIAMAVFRLRPTCGTPARFLRLGRLSLGAADLRAVALRRGALRAFFARGALRARLGLRTVTRTTRRLVTED